MGTSYGIFENLITTAGAIVAALAALAIYHKKFMNEPQIGTGVKAFGGFLNISGVLLIVYFIGFWKLILLNYLYILLFLLFTVILLLIFLRNKFPTPGPRAIIEVFYVFGTLAALVTASAIVARISLREEKFTVEGTANAIETTVAIMGVDTAKANFDVKFIPEIRSTSERTEAYISPAIHYTENNMNKSVYTGAQKISINKSEIIKATSQVQFIMDIPPEKRAPAYAIKLKLSMTECENSPNTGTKPNCDVGKWTITRQGID